MKANRHMVSMITLTVILSATQVFSNTSTQLSMDGKIVKVPESLSIREGLVPLR